MKEQQRYDSFCTEQKCLAEKNSFFVFDIDNVHIAEDHEAKSITPTTFIKFIKGQKTKASRNRQAMSMICTAVDRAIEEIVTILRVNLFDKYVKAAEDRSNQLEDFDLNSFINGLKQGNYTFLEAFLGNNAILKKNQKTIEGIFEQINSSIESRKAQLLSFMTIYWQNCIESIKGSIAKQREGVRPTVDTLNRMLNEYGKFQKLKIGHPPQMLQQPIFQLNIPDQKLVIIEEKEHKQDVDRVKIEASLIETFQQFQKKKELPHQNKIEIQIQADEQGEGQAEKKLSANKSKPIQKADKEVPLKKSKPRPFQQRFF